MLQKCAECQNKISVSVESCPQCGSKKPFKGIKLSREETKQLSWKERISFEKAGGKVTTGTFEKVYKTFVLIFIGFILFATMKPESKEEREKNIQSLINTINTTEKTNVDTLLSTYKKLSEYKPENKTYKSNYDKYVKLSHAAFECELESHKRNEQLIKNKSTFDTKTLDEYQSTKWLDEKTIIHQSSFSGKNDFGVEQRFVTKYKCILNNKGGFTIQRLLFQKI